MHTAFYKSPIGILKIYSSDYALKKIEMVKGSNDFECSTFNYKVIKQLDEYFAGRLHVFNIPFDMGDITEFQKKVYDELLKVRYGKTISYKELALKAGYKNAYRAVGSAMAQNPVPIIVPCHRVVKSDGSFGNYSLGSHCNKQFLLDFEKAHC